MDRRNTGQADDTRSDAELLASFRGGDTRSYGVLWERHRAAALRAARALAPDEHSADDLVQDAFHYVAVAIGRGSGPTEFFRAYLFTTMRHRASRLRRRAEREVVLDGVGDIPSEDVDSVVIDSDRRLVLAAFQRLPQRLRFVLWHVDVEERPLASVATALDTSANNVARLVGRGRRRLRTLFIQAHVDEWGPSDDLSCARTQSRLGAHITGELTRRDSEWITEHLGQCASCTDVHRTVADLASPIQRRSHPDRA